MTANDELSRYRAHVKQRLTYLADIFAAAAVGDFSKDVKIPAQEDEFTELYAGIQVMLEVIREQTETLQSKLLQNSAQISAILENSPDIIIVIDRDLKIIFVNRTAQGLKKSDVLGFPAVKYAAPADRDRLIEAYQRVFATGQPEVFEGHAIGSDNSVAWYRSSIAPIKAKGQPTESIVVISMDITSVRSSEEVLKQRNQDLNTLNRLMIGREVKMVELKQQLKDLQARLDKLPGEPSAS